MKSQLLANGLAGLIGFTSIGAVTAQNPYFGNPSCEHGDTTAAVILTPYYDFVDIPAFCSQLRTNREAKPGCASTEEIICEGRVNKERPKDGVFEWRFEFASGGCSAEDIEEIWTAAGGNELINFISC